MTAGLPNHMRGFQAHSGLVVVQITEKTEVSTSNDDDGNPTQWTYRAKRVLKTASGYAGWVSADTQRGAPELQTYNFREYLNDGDGRQGNGVNHDGTDYPVGFRMQSLEVGGIYPGMEVVAPDGSGGSVVEYWVWQANGEDGTCT